MPDEREDRECTDHAPETQVPGYLRVTASRADCRRRSLRAKLGINAYLSVQESVVASQGASVHSGLDERCGFVEERAHCTGPVALARVVKDVLVRAMRMVGVDRFAEKVLDDLDLLAGQARPASVRPRGHGSNDSGRD